MEPLKGLLGVAEFLEEDGQVLHGCRMAEDGSAPLPLLGLV
ncbi:hypothetical protein [Streptomyces sp. NPDC056682]